jgi:hypothetical protein
MSTVLNRSEVATGFESKNTTSRPRSLRPLNNDLGEHGKLFWSGRQSCNRQERTWRKGHKTLCRYSFSDLDLEKTCEYRRGLQLDDAERQSVLLVLLVNSSVRAVVTGRPRFFGARDSQPLHVVVQGRAFHPQTGCSAVRARDDAVRLF